MIQAGKVHIITSGVEAGTVETMPVTPEMTLIGNETLERSDLIFKENDKICITSEYSLASVIRKLDPARRNAVEVLKNKFRFREILSKVYPDYGFRFVRLEEIASLDIRKKSVVKPVRGIFGTAVRVIGPETDMKALESELDEEVRKNAKVYPDSVLASGDFLVEDFIEGEEYAVDMFYDPAGEPCIVNIMHHPLPSNEAYIHMMYNSSKQAFDEMYHKSKAFFRELNKVLKVTNFVMHTELRLSKGKIFPVEINSMRFGGMGLCNLIHYSHGINPFLCYLHDSEPDWENAWKGREDSVYSFFIAYNGVAIDVFRQRPMPGKLKSRFTNILCEQPFDHRKQLAFGVYFLEERPENIPELLKIEFDEYFEPI